MYDLFAYYIKTTKYIFAKTIFFCCEIDVCMRFMIGLNTLDIICFGADNLKAAL